jgi:hypothetical protein
MPRLLPENPPPVNSEAPSLQHEPDVTAGELLRYLPKAPNNPSNNPVTLTVSTRNQLPALTKLISIVNAAEIIHP